MARMHKKLALLVVLVASLTVVFAVVDREHETSSDSARTASPHGFGWQRGEVYEYLLRYDTVQSAAAGLGSEDGLSGAMQLEASYELTVHDVHAGRYLMSAGLTKLTHAALKLADQSLWATPAEAAPTFAGRRFFYEVDGAGKVLALFAPQPPADASPEAHLFAHTMQTLVSELSVRLGAAGQSAWQHDETTPFGAVVSRYRAKSEAARTFIRTREHAKSLRIAKLAASPVAHTLRSQHTFVLNEQRILARLEGSEELSARADDKPLQSVSTRLSLELRAVRRAEPAALAQAPGLRRAPDAWTSDEATERDHLEQRIDGLTFSELIDGVVALAGGAQRTDKARFLWRATGLLTLSPEQCATLVPLATRADARPALRALLLDMLASVPHTLATDAMVDILAADAVRADPGYTEYLQRLGMQEAPTERALRHVESDYERAREQKDDDTRLAAAYTLGSMARELPEAAPEVERIVTRLRTASAEAQGPEELAHHVKALGNVGREVVFPDVLSHRDHADAGVRAAVATALGSVDTSRARRELAELVADASPDVQREALRSLYRQREGADILSELASAVQHGVAAENVPYVFDLLKSMRATDAAGVSRVATALLASRALSAEHAQIAALLRDG